MTPCHVLKTSLFQHFNHNQRLYLYGQWSWMGKTLQDRWCVMGDKLVLAMRITYSWLVEGRTRSGICGCMCHVRIPIHSYCCIFSFAWCMAPLLPTTNTTPLVVLLCFHFNFRGCDCGGLAWMNMNTIWDNGASWLMQNWNMRRMKNWQQ